MKHLTKDNENGTTWCSDPDVFPYSLEHETYVFDAVAHVDCRECLRAAGQYGISAIERLAKLKEMAS